MIEKTLTFASSFSCGRLAAAVRRLFAVARRFRRFGGGSPPVVPLFSLSARSPFRPSGRAIEFETLAFRTIAILRKRRLRGRGVRSRAVRAVGVVPAAPPPGTEASTRFLRS